MKPPSLSIIIPAYREAGRIGGTLIELAAYLKQHKLKDVEVLVVIADSPDGTVRQAKAKADLFKNFRVIETGPVRGKGHQVRIGMLEATGEYRLFMDADLATPLHYLQNVQELAAQDNPVIIAVRDLNTSHTGLRKLVSSFGNWLVRFTLLPGIRDSQCGFKAFSAEAAEELFRRQYILGWGFDMEVLAIARLQGYTIKQILTPDWSDQPDGVFEGKVASAAVETLGELAAIIARRWTGRYRHKHFNYQPHHEVKA